MEIKSICVFCGSSDTVSESYLEIAKKLGALLSEKQIRLIFGGSNTGLMGAVSRSVIDNGGEAVGIIPEFFYNEKNIDDNLSRIEVLPDMHSRKARMSELSDAFIALPGGFGTLEELFESVTWGQIGIQSKPVGLLNHDGFFDTLLLFIDELKENGFIYERHREIMLSDTSINGLITKFSEYSKPPKRSKWKV